MNLRNITILLVLVAASISATALTDREQKIADRLAPVGETCMAGDACSSGAAATVSGPKDPEQVYNTYCMACHMTGAAGAPIMGDVAAWAERLDSKGIDVVYSNAIAGIGGMPAKGLCMDCSDDDVVATIDYILEKSK